MVHSYFAYGSNLCVNQMSRRCPNAADPRPATLADHDWLINERGVATVEPFDGSQVHGVVWQLDDHDLATLDRAEGVPVRYSRDRLTWIASSTGRINTGCRTAGSSSSAAGIRRSGRYPRTVPKPARHNLFRSCSPTRRCSRKAHFGPGSVSWPSMAAAWSR